METGLLYSIFAISIEQNELFLGMMEFYFERHTQQKKKNRSTYALLFYINSLINQTGIIVIWYKTQCPWKVKFDMTLMR